MRPETENKHKNYVKFSHIQGHVTTPKMVLSNLLIISE